MPAEEAAPCRHPGAPPDEVIDRVVAIFGKIKADPKFLASYGVSAEEYELALPAAIERFRGSRAAGNAARRKFLADLLEALKLAGACNDVQSPRYGDDTVYRLAVPGLGDVAIIQKGCPDGAHSSTRWTRPDWAKEAYLWWLCSSTTHEPGEHIGKGVNRLKQRFFSHLPDTVDGVIFHNDLCGSPERPCPKMGFALSVGGSMVPPPCIYVMPDRVAGVTEWNWSGTRELTFPARLLTAFGIAEAQVPMFTSHVGFQQRRGFQRVNIISRFGPGRSTTFRS